MELKGKPLSLGAKILATVIVVGSLVIKAVLYPDLDIDAAVKVGIFVVAIFGTVDLSLIAEAVFGRGGRGDLYYRAPVRKNIPGSSGEFGDPV